DFLGGDFFRRHDAVQLIVGDIAALLGELDHLLDGGVGEIEQRAVAHLDFGFFARGRGRRHAALGGRTRGGGDRGAADVLDARGGARFFARECLAVARKLRLDRRGCFGRQRFSRFFHGRLLFCFGRRLFDNGLLDRRFFRRGLFRALARRTLG